MWRRRPRRHTTAGPGSRELQLRRAVSLGTVAEPVLMPRFTGIKIKVVGVAGEGEPGGITRRVAGIIADNRKISRGHFLLRTGKSHQQNDKERYIPFHKIFIIFFTTLGFVSWTCSTTSPS